VSSALSEAIVGALSLRGRNGHNRVLAGYAYVGRTRETAVAF
jgi:hypothetical protein